MDTKKEFLLPSGLSCTIRMQNGEDEELLTSVRLMKSGDNINAFLASIITEFRGKKPTISDIVNMRLSDKYFTLIMSRIFSMGSEMEFQYKWDDKNLPEPVVYTEDLNLFIWDYSKPFPEPGDEAYNPHRIKPFPETGSGEGITWDYNYIYFNGLDGNRFRIRMIDGHLEKYLTSVGEDGLNANSILMGRELSQLYEKSGEKEQSWIKVQTFKNFSPREMAHFRKVITLVDDGNNSLMVDIENPASGETITISLLQIEDFLTPRLI